MAVLSTKKYLQDLARKRRPFIAPAIAVVLATAGVVMITVSDAAGFLVSSQAEQGTVTAPASVVADPNASGGSAVRFGSAAPPTGTPTEPNLKVAFVGDTVLTSQTRSLLALIKNEGAQLLVHLGDFDYVDSPSNWESQTNTALGNNFPQISVIGNHDENVSGYQAAMRARLSRTPEVVCNGDVGVRMDCTFKGLRVVGTAPGLVNAGSEPYDAYIKQRLAASTNIWNICAWHVNMSAMQAGAKENEAGWPVYEECRLGGGMPMSGHEHSYSRTKTLTSMSNQTVDPTCATPARVCVAKGKTFATVSGLGGRTSIDPQSRCTPTTYPYGCKGEWAKFHTSSQGATFSALFITFNVDNDPNKARGYLKDIAGKVIETFEIVRQ